MWKQEIIGNMLGYKMMDQILVNNNICSEEVTLWRDSVFAERALSAYSTTWCEQALGEELLGNALSHAGLDSQSVVMDLGCGDGRYVRYLLDRGFSKIVALNYELEPLLSLKESLSNEEVERVLFVCTDVMAHPFQTNVADFIVAWGLFTSVPDFKKALDVCIDLLKVGKYIFNAEPVLEHALVYSLVMNDHEEFIRTLTTKTRARMWDDKESRYRVFLVSELEELMITPRLERTDTGGISVLPSLLFGGVLAAKETVADKDVLWKAIESLGISWNRQVTYFSKKIK